MKTRTSVPSLPQLASFRNLFGYAALFSCVVNILLLAPSIYMLQVFDRVLTSRSNETLVLMTILTIACLLAMMLVDLARARLLMWLGIALDQAWGPRVLSKLLVDARDPRGSGSVHGLRDVATLRGFLTGSGILALFDAPWLPAYLILIFLFHPLLGALATAGAAALLALAYVNERISRRPLEELQGEGRRAARFIDACLRNAEVVGALGMIGNVTGRWQQLNDVVLERQIESSRAATLMNGFIKLMRQLIQVCVMAAGAYLVIDMHVTAGVMLACTVLLGRALAPVESAIAGWKGFVEARAALQRLEAILSGEPEHSPAVELPTPAGALRLENVNFAVRGRERSILKGISFDLAAGESLGLIGPSASGKSSLARLLVGVWNPTSGAVRLDGTDLAGWPRDRAGRFLGYLPQDVELFAGTVGENLARLGQMDSDAIVRAAQRAHAHEMILRLPQGYETQIGDGGAVLSGGQRQRIALARALYGDPRIVVLDEPNASLDGEGEAALVSAMADLKRDGVSLIVIAHRPTLLAHVDKLIALREGAIEMTGSREEIFARLARASMHVSTVTPSTIVRRA